MIALLESYVYMYYIVGVSRLIPAFMYPCEATVTAGLESVAREEIQRLRCSGAVEQAGPGALRFEYRGDLTALLQLRTVIAVYLVCRFAVPRPRALLGEEHLRSLLASIALVRGLARPDPYRTLAVSAAGSDSAVLTRLKQEIAARTGLMVATGEGDLQLRLRRTPGADTGWDVLIRLSTRPLATRSWRVCNREGALNAAVAHAMVLLTRPQDDDLFLNIACGSATLLIERAIAGSARRIVGCDTGSAALACARVNVAASGFDTIELYDWDARMLPLPDDSVDALCADLPFGHLVGSHEENKALYPRLLDEAARVAWPGARFALITHEARLTERLLAGTDTWALERRIHIDLGDVRPSIFVLQRRRG